MSVDWSYFDKFEGMYEKYLPRKGEGDTKATQIVTAVCKLVYKWYNDEDVFDNTYLLSGWVNNLSSYANWLNGYTEAGDILFRIKTAKDESDYEDLLKDLADALIQEDYLKTQNEIEKIGTIYECDGPFKFEDKDDFEDDEWEEDEDEWDW